MEEKKLTPMRFRPERVERKWGIAEYRIADLGYIDSVALDGWLSGNSISDIMQTYLERFTGEVPFEYYGTQFPVMVKWLDIKGRTSLHVNPDDESAEQRYDAFGKTALWYVAEAGADAKLFLGFKREVTAEEFPRRTSGSWRSPNPPNSGSGSTPGTIRRPNSIWRRPLT